MHHVILLLVSVLLTHSAWARDFGDQNCNVVTVNASSMRSESGDNRYVISVAVSKSVIGRDFKNPIVRLQTSESADFFSPVAEKQLEHYRLYDFKLPFGANNKSEGILLLPYISNNIDRLFDNNFGTGMIELASSNGWKFQQTRCEIR